MSRLAYPYKFEYHCLCTGLENVRIGLRATATSLAYAKPVEIDRLINETSTLGGVRSGDDIADDHTSEYEAKTFDDDEWSREVVESSEDKDPNEVRSWDEDENWNVAGTPKWVADQSWRSKGMEDGILTDPPEG